MKRIGINGFGRIGRLVLRRILETELNVEIVAINDLTSPDVLAYLLKYDSNYIPLTARFPHADGSIIVNGKVIKVFAEKNAGDIPWGSTGIDVVVECTGFYTSAEKANAHIEAGAKKCLSPRLLAI